MSDDLRLNSVGRFRKQPERLILEEHSHCEVPAGCGGVILRWRNPHAAIPLTVCLYTPVAATCLLDEAEPQSTRINLAPGRHVLAVALKDVDLSAGLLMFAGTYDPQRYQTTPPTHVAQQPIRIVSAGDGTWKFTLADPGPAPWTTLEFDDQGWSALVQVRTPELPNAHPGAYQVRRCQHEKAVCLGLPAPARGKELTSWWQRLLGRQKQATPMMGNIWIRTVFEIPAPQVV